jgi:hypothetical protein
MSKFVQINESQNPQYATILNLDLVAKVELSPRLSIESQKSPEVEIKLVSVDRFDLTTLKFENREAANRWVLLHLGIEL